MNMFISTVSNGNSIEYIYDDDELCNPIVVNQAGMAINSSLMLLSYVSVSSLLYISNKVFQESLIL